MKGLVLCLLGLIITSCDLAPVKVSVNDPAVLPLMSAARTFHRVEYGFTPLPKTGTIYLEVANGVDRNYDAMLHFDDRTISLRKAGTGYRWTGEQQIFKGPKTYTSVDGTYSETITLTYETEHISGYALNRLNIDYTGEDPRITGRELKLEETRRILREWGY